MSNIFNPDFRDFIEALNNAKVNYILVGGFSVILHGYSRTTGDLDIWVDRSAINYEKIKKAFINFKMQVFDMTESNFLNHAIWEVFTFGVPPSAIDMMVKLKGLNFIDCLPNAIDFEDDGLIIKCIHFDDLIKAKKVTHRSKDLDDIENLTKNK